MCLQHFIVQDFIVAEIQQVISTGLHNGYLLAVLY